MIAFDYEKQVWVNGREAAQIRLKQLEVELELMRGPRAVEYMTFRAMGAGHVRTAIETCERGIAECRDILEAVMTVDWAYATSPNADRFGYPNGCWVVNVTRFTTHASGARTAKTEALRGFLTKDEAEGHAAALPYRRMMAPAQLATV